MAAEPATISAHDGYALWADSWDATPSPIVALEERMLLPWIARLQPGCVIDIGCGTGRWMERLSAIGIDASPAMLSVAARKPGLRGRLSAGDAAALPFAGGCADSALCTLTLGHVPDRAAALREVIRILKPGGSFLLTDFHPAAVARGWRRTFRHEGLVYELEHHPYTVVEIQEDCTGLVLNECLEAVIGEPERRLFEEARRPELFDAACGTPAVLLTKWTRV
jgi:SAM-dependent methyltransferase